MTNIKNTEKEYWFRRHPRMAIFTVVLFLFFIILFFVEIFLGFKFQNDSWKKDIAKDKEGRVINLVEFAPLIDTYDFPTDLFIEAFDVKNLVQQNYKFRTDSSGYIMPSKIHSNPDLTIAFLGGSTTECLFVKEVNKFPNFSRKLLEDKTGKKINSLNAGVRGMNSMHGINILINKLLPEKPDYVILMYNINDLATLLYTGTYWNQSSRSLIKEKEKISSIQKIKLGIKSLIPNTYSLMKNLFNKKNTDEWADYRNKKIELNSDLIRESYEKSLTTFINICKSWNIEPVLMTQANRFLNDDSDNYWAKDFDVNYSDLINTYHQMNKTIRETAIKNNTILIDLEQAIPKDTLHLYDVVHLNDNGSILASKKIANVLDNHLKEEIVLRNE